MSEKHTETGIRELSAQELDAAAGALHIHIRGLFHLEITGDDVSVGVLGHGVGYNATDGVYRLRFN